MKFIFYSALLILSLFVMSIQSFAQLTHQWSYGFGSPQGSDYGSFVKTDENGDVFVSGNFVGSVDYSTNGTTQVLTSAGSWDVFLARYTSEGEIVYVIQNGGPEGDAGGAFAVDSTGNIYLTSSIIGTSDFDPGPGVFELTSLGGFDIFLSKYDSSGNFIYAFGIGSVYDDSSLDIVTDAQGFVYISGLFIGVVDFDPGPDEYILQPLNTETNTSFFAKYDSDGHLVFAKALGGTYSEFSLYDLEVDAAGNVYLTGDFTETADFDPGPGEVLLTASDYDIFFAKYDPQGDLVFVKRIEGDIDIVSIDLVLDHQQNIIISGYYYNFADFDPDFGEFWLHIFGTRETFIAKYDQEGTFINAITLQGSPNSTGQGSGLDIDTDDNIYLVGRFTNDVDFDPGEGTAWESCGSDPSGIFVATYDPDLNFRDAFAVSGDNLGYVPKIAIDHSDNVFITGSFYHDPDFDPGPGQSILDSHGYDDIFLAKYSTGDLNGAHQPTAGGISISPNPASGSIRLSVDDYLPSALLSFCNAAGQSALSIPNIRGQHFDTDLSHLPAGIYFATIIAEDKSYRSKVVVKR